MTNVGDGDDNYGQETPDFNAAVLSEFFEREEDKRQGEKAPVPSIVDQYRMAQDVKPDEAPELEDSVDEMLELTLRNVEEETLGCTVEAFVGELLKQKKTLRQNVLRSEEIAQFGCDIESVVQSLFRFGRRAKTSPAVDEASRFAQTPSPPPRHGNFGK